MKIPYLKDSNIGTLTGNYIKRFNGLTLINQSIHDAIQYSYFEVVRLDNGNSDNWLYFYDGKQYTKDQLFIGE